MPTQSGRTRAGLQAGFDDLSRMLQILDVNWRIHSRKLRTETEDDEHWKSAREDLWGTGDRNVTGSVIDQKTAEIEQIAESKIEELRPTPGFSWPWS